MRKLLVAACLCASSGLNLGDPALAQNTTGRVIATCGSVSPLFNVGNPGPFTIDVNGVLCTSSGGGGSSVTQGTTPWIVDSNNGSNILNSINAPVPWLASTAWNTNTYTTGATVPGNADLHGAPWMDVGAFGGIGIGAGGLTVAPSTAPVTATNPAMVVDLRPDSPGIIALGQTTKALSVPVAIASDQLGPQTASNSLPITVGPALLGSYCMGASTGTMAAGLAGGSPIYSFRYGGANLAIIRRVSAEADDITTAFVAGAAKLDLIAARAFTASDTGGTAATLTGNNGKLRTSFATTGVSDLRISSTATLGTGTRTLDAQPLATVEFGVTTSIDAGLLPTTDLIRQNVGESPLILATNEGFVIQATVPGTGTWEFSARVCWDEVTAF